MHIILKKISPSPTAGTWSDVPAILATLTWAIYKSSPYISLDIHPQTKKTLQANSLEATTFAADEEGFGEDACIDALRNSFTACTV